MRKYRLLFRQASWKTFSLITDFKITHTELTGRSHVFVALRTEYQIPFSKRNIEEKILLLFVRFLHWILANKSEIFF